MGKQWKQGQTLFLGAPNTADGDSSHEIKRRSLLGRKIMTNLDSIVYQGKEDLKRTFLAHLSLNRQSGNRLEASLPGVC